MTTVLEEPRVEAAHQMRTTMAAARVSFTWFGVCKSLTREQKDLAADSFGANGDVLSAGKKLVDTRHPKYKAVTAVRNRIVQYWKAVSLPYPEPGLRLIRQDRIDAFDRQMRELHSELLEAVEQLDLHYDALKTAARRRLGSLYSESDYPVTLSGLFAVEWDFPSVEPPDYLRQLNPTLYEQECERVRSRFEESVRLAQEAFLAEFSQVVSHLCERLSGDQDGKPKIFRDSAVNNLREFFERFRSLNVGSDAELERLVDQAQDIVRGVQPEALRTQTNLRQQIATQLSGVQSVLDGLLVDRPRRNIIRRPR